MDIQLLSFRTDQSRVRVLSPRPDSSLFEDGSFAVLPLAVFSRFFRAIVVDGAGLGDEQGFIVVALLVHLRPDLLDQVVILDGLQHFLAVRVYVPWHFGGSVMLLFSLLPDELSLFL